MQGEPAEVQESTPIETLAEWQSRRYWVERALQDAKGLAGLDAPNVPIITLQDALEILKVALPKKELSFDEAIELIYQRHLNRFRSRNCRLNKQQAWLREHGVVI